jgi:glucose/arabinose dehydrogenase
MGNSQRSRNRISSWQQRTLDEYEQAGRNRRRFASRLHQQCAPGRFLWLAVVLHRQSSGSALQKGNILLADKVIVPDVLVQAHSATLNLCFYTGDQFPAEYKGDIFAAFHGSWNRMKRTGYKVVRVPFDHSTAKARGEYQDFVTGFLTLEGKVWGRPVGITVAKDGSLLISEDGNGTIWHVSYGR